MKKLVLISMVIFSMILPSIVLGSEANEQNRENSRDLTKLTKLIKLDLIENIDYSGNTLSAHVTRAEFALLITKYMGLENINDQVNADSLTPYIDVEQEMPAFGAIVTLSNTGHMNGDGNKRFYPNRELTYNEAVSILLNVLGYKELAMLKGGYPYGYIIVSAEKKVSKNIDMNDENPVSLLQVFELFNNCCDIDVATQKTFNINGEITYNVEKDNTFLYYYHKIEKTKGIVTANQYTSLAEPNESFLGKHIEINEKRYFNDNKTYNALLGMNVDYYYRSSKEEEQLLYLSPNKNETRHILSENILDASDNTIRYQKENQKENKVSLASDVAVIYNGIIYTGYGMIANAMPQEGYVECIDNDDDSKVDVIIAVDNRNIFVDMADAYHEKIYDKYSNDVVDFSNDYVEFYLSDTTALSMDDINEKDVLSIQKSKNTIGKTLTSVIVSRNSFDGKISEISEDESYLINGSYYQLSGNFKDSLNVGDEFTFYLDFMGKIAGIDMVVTGTAGYAVLVASGYKNSLSSELQFKLFTEKEKFVTYPCEKKITFNGKTMTTTDQKKYKNLSPMLSNGTVIRYKISKDNKIIYIEAAEENSRKPYYILSKSNTFRYRYGRVDGEFLLTSNTIIFSIPTDLSDQTKYARVDLSAFDEGTTYNRNYIAYALGKNDVPRAAAFVMITDSSAISVIGKFPPFSLITKICTALNEYDESAEKVSVITRHGTKDYFTDVIGYCCANDIKIGDVVKIASKGNNVKSVEKVFYTDGRSGAELQPNVCHVKADAGVFDAEIMVMYATYLGQNNSYMNFSLMQFKDDGSSEKVNYIGYKQWDSVYLKYNISSNAYETISPQTLKRGDIVLLRLVCATIGELILLK